MLMKLTRCGLAAATLCAAPAFAATPFGEYVTLSGFGTIGAVVTDTDDAQFKSSLRQGRGADKSADWGVDSKLGLQANAQFNDTFSAVGQILVSRAITNSAALEWLYGEAKLPAGFSLKLGRMVLPTFMVSDSRSVGYAAHWLRAPSEVYALYPASSFDGGQIVYRRAIGPVNLTAQLSAGKAKTTLAAFGQEPVVPYDKLRSVNLILTSGDWLIRVGQTSADSRFEGLPLPEFKDTFTGIGVQYDDGQAVVMAEYTTRRNESSGGALFDSDSWYASAGWRFGSVAPYLSISRYTPKGVALTDRKNDTTEAIGVRWDVMPNVALKAQIQNTRSTSLSFIQAAPTFTATKPKVRVMSVALDFVF